MSVTLKMTVPEKANAGSTKKMEEKIKKLDNEQFIFLYLITLSTKHKVITLPGLSSSVKIRTGWIFFAVMLSHMALAQEQKQIAQTQMGFLDIPVCAKISGMGGAGVGVSVGTEALFINPAGLGTIENHWEVSFHQTSYIAEMQLYGIALAKGFRNIGTLAISAIHMDYGELIRTVRTDNPAEPYLNLGAFSPLSIAVGLAYARQHTDRFYFGGQIKVIHENLGTSRLGLDQEGKDISKGYRDVENTLTLVAIDFGTRYFPGFGDLNLSASWRNFSSESSYAQQGFPLPLLFTFGFAMDVFSPFNLDLSKSHAFTVAMDYLQVRDFNNKFHMGFEYKFQKRFSIRSGYKFGYDEEGLTAGFGIRFLNISGYHLYLDYSYGDFGLFNDTHRYSLQISKE